MLNVSGVCKITKLGDLGTKCLKGTVYFSNKDQNEEWETHFFDSIICGDAVLSILNTGIKDKDSVEIEGFLKTRTYKDKTYTQLIILKCEKYVAKDEVKADGKPKSKFSR